MNITLQTLKVEDSIDHKFVRHTFASQEVFLVDMLNRILVELCAMRDDKAVCGFMLDLYEDARRSPLDKDAELTFDGPTRSAFDACVAVDNPVVGLSLLRMVRLEQLMLEFGLSKLGLDGQSRLRDVAVAWRADDLPRGKHGTDTQATRGMQQLLKLTGEQLLGRELDAEWYFSELLNLPYAVEDELLFPAQIMLIKGYTLRALDRTLHDLLNGDGVARQFEAWRYEYLFRQTQLACVALSGVSQVQYGLPAGEADEFLFRVFRRA